MTNLLVSLFFTITTNFTDMADSYLLSYPAQVQHNQSVTVSSNNMSTVIINGQNKVIQLDSTVIKAGHRNWWDVKDVKQYGDITWNNYIVPYMTYEIGQTNNIVLTNSILSISNYIIMGNCYMGGGCYVTNTYDNYDVISNVLKTRTNTLEEMK